MRKIDAYMMLSPGHRAFDWTGGGFEHAGDHDASLPASDICVELEPFEQWRMNGARHRRINPPVSRPLARFFGIHDGHERVALPVVRPLIDDSLTLAIALVNRSRPGIEKRCTETIERDLAKVSLIDAKGGEAATVSMGWTRRAE